MYPWPYKPSGHITSTLTAVEHNNEINKSIFYSDSSLNQYKIKRHASYVLQVPSADLKRVPPSHQIYFLSVLAPGTGRWTHMPQ